MPNPLREAGLMTTADVAEYLGVTGERVRQHRNAGEIAPVGRIGRGDLYRVKDAEALLALRARRGYKVPAESVPPLSVLTSGELDWPESAVIAS